MPTTRLVSPGRSTFEVLVLAFVLALVVSASAQTPAAPVATVPVDRKVTITFTGAELVVEPEVFVAQLGGPGVEFEIKGLSQGQTVEIDFRPQGKARGPFARQTGRVRGRHQATGTGKGVLVSVSSGPVDTAVVRKPSYWKYDVVVRDQNGNDLAVIDPGGVLK
jgi:hypothetical protein